MISKYRTPLAFVVSIAWLVLIWKLSIAPKGGFQYLLGKDINEIGDFLSGLFAPLAFFWFVIAYWQQSDELRDTRAELQRQADSIEANEKHAKRDLFFSTARQMLEQLRQTAIFVGIKMTGVGIPEWDSQESNSLRWTALQMGYADAPMYYLSYFLETQIANRGIISGHLRPKPGVMEAIDHYCNLFERLLEMADEISPVGDRTLRDFYQNGRTAQLYVQFCQIAQRQSAMRYS